VRAARYFPNQLSIQELAMSFQAYMENIEAKTGKSPADFKKLAAKKGFMQNGVLREDLKAGEVVAWLKEDFALGHGHAMALYAFFKGKTG
jgi:hypothetical protein